MSEYRSDTQDTPSPQTPWRRRNVHRCDLSIIWFIIKFVDKVQKCVKIKFHSVACYLTTKLGYPMPNLVTSQAWGRYYVVPCPEDPVLECQSGHSFGTYSSLVVQFWGLGTDLYNLKQMPCSISQDLQGVQLIYLVTTMSYNLD